VIVKKARSVAGAASGLVLVAAVAMLAAGCSHDGSAASSPSSAPAPGDRQAVSAPATGASVAPADTGAPAASAVAVPDAAPPSASGIAQLPTSSSAATSPPPP
jgi:hypothetical protein